MSNRMTAEQHAAFLKKVRQAVDYRVRNPRLTLTVISEKFEVSRCTIRKYSVAWHPEIFEVKPRQSARRAIPDAVTKKEAKRKTRRALFADAGDGWVRPECIPAGKKFEKCEVLEYYE